MPHVQVDKKELEAVALKKDLTEKLQELQAQVRKYERELEDANKLAAEQREAEVVRKTQVLFTRYAVLGMWVCYCT